MLIFRKIGILLFWFIGVVIKFLGLLGNLLRLYRGKIRGRIYGLICFDLSLYLTFIREKVLRYLDELFKF